MEESQLSSIMNTVSETHDQVIKLTVIVNSLIARLEAFEKMHSSNTVASKRSIKVATTNTQQDTEDNQSVSSIDSKSKNVVVNNNTSEEKIINALTFFKKYIIYKNYNNLRSKYSNQEIINNISSNIKKVEGTEAYWISIGNSIWKILDKDQKKCIKDEFIKWKKINQSNFDSTQLNEDDDNME
jgi:tRNA nucleotidyltransferase/poly(A) polymerase